MWVGPKTAAVPVPWTRLPLVFDPRALGSEVAAVPADAWIKHFNRGDYVGGWSSVALRSRSGGSEDIEPRGAAAQFRDTPLAALCPGLMRAARTFQFPLKSVRLLRLDAHSRILEHRDRDLGLRDGEIRIHVAVTSNDQVEFVVANRRLELRPGESWFIDFSQPHRIDNAGDTDRVHLVIDGEANAWALGLIERASREIESESREPDGMRELRLFRAAVFEDPLLQAELAPHTDRERFLDALIAVAARRGFRVRRIEAESWLQQAQTEWLERTLDS